MAQKEAEHEHMRTSSGHTLHCADVQVKGLACHRGTCTWKETCHHPWRADEHTKLEPSICFQTSTEQGR
eukprot:1145757-Pelagomonas_calceolata.AAC.2